MSSRTSVCVSAAVWAENPLSDIYILLSVPFSNYTVCYLGGCIMGNVQCFRVLHKNALLCGLFLLGLLIPRWGDTTHHTVENHMSYGIVNNKNETG